jgi:hypothetical protein
LGIGRAEQVGGAERIRRWENTPSDPPCRIAPQPSIVPPTVTATVVSPVSVSVVPETAIIATRALLLSARTTAPIRSSSSDSANEL